MFTVKNLRKEKKDGWTYLIVDFDVKGMESPFEEKTMWFAVEDKNADMLTDDVYDAFVLVPLYLGMHYHQDVHIEGKISPRLYHNVIHYLIKIFDNFSDYTKPVNFTVDGFKKPKKAPIDLVATGITCGVDSLTTIYDNFIETNDEDFKLNALILANSGTHGHYEDERTRGIWLARAELNKKAADELGLPTFLIDSNLHAFTHKVTENRMGFIAIYSCALALQKYIRRYLTSSGSSYDDCSKYSLSERDVDMSCYCETYMPHLVSTEIFELVIDGCQYTRSEKIEKICDWDIAQRYLNVCIEPDDDGKNCSACQKCVRTLLVLESLGKLDNYKKMFDLNTYKRNRGFFRDMYLQGGDAQSKSLTKYLREHHKASFLDIMIAYPRFFTRRVIKKVKKMARLSK